MDIPKNNKTTVYVSGLHDEVTEQMLHASFIPFGDIVQVQIPPDPTNRMSLEYPEDFRT